KNHKISFVLESEPRGFTGNGKLDAVLVEHIPSGEKRALKTDGAFIFAGYQPNTGVFSGVIQLNKRGEIVVDSDMKTTVEGVFAAGDCIAKKYRHITTAVAEGTIAALSASEFLRN